MVTKSEQLIHELCRNGKLEEHRKILSQIVKEIEDLDCIISCHYLNNESYIEQRTDIEVKSHIRISLKANRTDPLEIIWDILHEYGHHLSGKKNKEDLTLEREKEAWGYALIEAKKYFDSEEELACFEKYKNLCLKTYSMTYIR